MIGPFYHSRKYFMSDAILLLYKSQMRPKMKYYCNIWRGSVQSTLSCLATVQNQLCNLVEDDIFPCDIFRREKMLLATIHCLFMAGVSLNCDPLSSTKHLTYSQPESVWTQQKRTPLLSIQCRTYINEVPSVEQSGLQHGRLQV